MTDETKMLAPLGSTAVLGADLPRTIVADPPWWPSLHKNTKGRTEGRYRAGPQRYYTLLPVEVIEAMRPETAPKAHLYLWALNQHLDWAVRVARAWGFEPQQTLTWCKPGYGTGQFQCNTEQVLLCRKGGPVGNAFGKTGGTWFQWPRGRHSQKPEAFYDLVERVSPGPHHEMFARRVRPGWTAMGNEVTGVFEAPNAPGKPTAANEPNEGENT
jgi:N6-adenosine-specific RNA methylase IME4